VDLDPKLKNLESLKIESFKKDLDLNFLDSDLPVRYLHCSSLSTLSFPDPDFHKKTKVLQNQFKFPTKTSLKILFHSHKKKSTLKKSLKKFHSNKKIISNAIKSRKEKKEK